MKSKIVTMLLCCLVFFSCGGGDDGPSDNGKPALNLSIVSSDASSITLRMQTVNATSVRVLCTATIDTSSQTAQSVVKNGKAYTQENVTIDGLSPNTVYTLFAVACNDQGGYGALQHVQFSTTGSVSDMYPWEQQRSGILSFTDLVLCYGGSHHRTPYLWDKERFAPFVTYKDRQGVEHWLFDGFLCMEFCSVNRPDGKNYAYMLGQDKAIPAAGKEQWQELIDYWFGNDTGVNALETTVREASLRLGTPSVKRKVIMVLPDPIIYQLWADTNSTTVYWGSLNGHALDFSTGEDRVAAYKWYIDEVRRRFDTANYQYIELAGFYLLSEEIVTPTSGGWDYKLKRSEEIVPPASKYLHSLNECLCWIPYNRASGYKIWREMGIDYAYMQPNYYWEGKKSFTTFFSDIEAYDLSMEFEFDEDKSFLEGQPDCAVYKARFREYMANAKANGIYGRKPLSYYQGTNGLYDLWASSAEKDKELYHEFCQFVIDNPIRN